MIPDAGDLPAARGAYALVLRLVDRCTLSIPTLGEPALPAGLYLYAGSAWGGGGIRARVGRHLRRDKAPRWHIDHLTARAVPERVFVYPGGRECAIVDLALAVPSTRAPIAGFGASDCRRCPSHLLAIEPETAGALVGALAISDSPGSLDIGSPA